MRDIRLQFFFTLGALGTVMPYVSVFFRHAGLSDVYVGYAYAIWSLTSLLSPLVVTLVADAKADPRRLLAFCSAVTAVSLFLIGFAHGKSAVIGLWTVYCAASVSIYPLQDGVHFSLQRRRRERGVAIMPYHMVRVWGTIGFISPSLILFLGLAMGMNIRGVLFTGATFALLAAIQAGFLPDPRARYPADSEAEAERRLPTFRALRALRNPQLLIFCVAIVLVQMAAALHSAFYPIYLTERVGLSDKWLGPASNVAVIIEILLTFACGWLLSVLGVKRLLLLGMMATALRMGLIAVSTVVWVAVGTQIFHGLLILATGVVPHTIVDTHADDRFRHSMQGLLLIIISFGQAVASFVGGRLAASNLSEVFAGSAALCLLATGLIFVWFKEPEKPSNIPQQGESPGFSVVANELAPALVQGTPDVI